MSVDPRVLKYKNITVSGKICTGTSTLVALLVKTLGWESWSGGEFFRDYCRKHNLELEEAGKRSDELARKVDYGMRERLQKEEGIILEAWLSGFVAQGVGGVLKVLLSCNDDLRVDRFVNRDRVSVDEAVRHIKKREKENLKKWRRVYEKEWKQWVVTPGTVSGDDPVDFFDPRLYDLVIDTYSHSREETLEKALDVLGYKGRVI
jgi:cytidylate kinase